MKKLQAANGGRPFANDDLIELQAEVYDAIEATLQGAPPMVLSGCGVFAYPSGNQGDIAAGYLWIAGEIQRYPGANAVPLPAEVVAGPVDETDLRTYQTGGSLACMAELTLVTQAAGTAAAGTGRVRFLAGGATRTYAKWQESQVRQLGDLQDSVAPATVGTLCDATGLGIGARLGWALANGNNGTKDLRKLFRVAYSDNPADAGGDYDTPGKQGGREAVSLTTAQLAPHSHTFPSYKQPIQYDRGSTGGSPDWGAGTVQGNTGTTGQGEAHENRPPYFVTVVWQYVGLAA